MSEQHPQNQNEQFTNDIPELRVSLYEGSDDPASFETVLNHPEYATTGQDTDTVSTEREAEIPIIDNQADENSRTSKPEEDVDAAREAVEKSLKSEEEVTEEPTAQQRAAASAKISETAQAAARPVKKRRSSQDRSTRVSSESRDAVDKAHAEGEAKRAAKAAKETEAPQTTPIMGERDGTAEKPAKQTVVTEGTDGQEYITEPTTARPNQARIPKEAATEARQVPDAVIPTQEQSEPTAPEEPKKVIEGTIVEGTYGSSAAKQERVNRLVKDYAERIEMPLNGEAPQTPEAKTIVGEVTKPQAEETLGATREEQIDEDVLAAMGGYDTGRPAKKRDRNKARREAAADASTEEAAAPAEPISEPEAPRRPSPADMPGARGRRNGPSPADMPRRRPTTEEPVTSEPDTPAMSPDEARASAHRRAGEPERTFGQPHSDDTVAYLKAAGPAETGTPYVKPGEGSSSESSEEVPAKKTNESPFSDTEVFSGDDDEILDGLDFEAPDFESEVLKTADNRDTRTPEEVEADDAAAEAARTAAASADPRGAMRNSARNRLGGFGDRSRNLGSTALGGEDNSWADEVFDDADFGDEGEPDPFAYLYRDTPETTSGDHEDDDHDSDDDDNEAGRSLTDDLLGDFGEPEPTRRTRRERVGAAFRTGWDKARTYFTGRDLDSNAPDRDRRIAGRQLKVMAGAVGATVLAGALFSGLAGDTSNEGPTHVGKGPSASAEKTPGAKVDSGKTEVKPSESATGSDKKESKKPSATVDDDHRHEHGAGTGDVSHTFDVGRETVKVSTDNEVVVTLKQGGTVWDALDKIGDELHINHSDEDIAKTVQTMKLKPGQDRQMKVGSSYTFKVQGGKLVAKK